MAKKKVNEKMIKNEDDRKLYSFLSVLLLIVGFIVAIILWKKEKYIMFYAKQSLIFFLGFIIILALKILPAIGDALYVICVIGLVVLWVITLINALSGNEKKTFLIGDLAEKIKL